MKRILMLTVAVLTASFAFAQEKMASPKAAATGKIGAATITIDYHQPAVKGRKVWGDLVPFDQVWRTGANNATTFTTDKDVKIEGQALKAGKYSLFTIPTAKGDWTIVFNKTAEQWGAYDYKSADDVLRVKVQSAATDAAVERMTFAVEANAVVLTWEKLKVGFKVE